MLLQSYIKNIFQRIKDWNVYYFHILLLASQLQAKCLHCDLLWVYLSKLGILIPESYLLIWIFQLAVHINIFQFWYEGHLLKLHGAEIGPQIHELKVWFGGLCTLYLLENSSSIDFSGAKFGSGMLFYALSCMGQLAHLTGDEFLRTSFCRCSLTWYIHPGIKDLIIYSTLFITLLIFYHRE